MISYYGDFAEDDTVLIPFNTFTSDDPSASSTITNLADADIKVHKDGSLTQIVTDGATVIINFDSITGNHLITIDTSVHADYSTGSEYAVRVEGTTVDGAVINAWVGAFSIERAGGALALIKLITAAGPTKSEMDTAHALLATPAQVATELATYNGPTEAEMNTAHALLATEAKQDIIDTVVDVIAAKLVGITLLSEWLGAMAGKQASDATAQTEMRASGAGSGTYLATADSQEANSDDVASVQSDTDNMQTRLPASLVSGRMDSDVGAMQSAIENAIADALLARNIAGGSSSGRIVTQALDRLRNKVTIAGGTMTVKKVNDTTDSWTAAVATTAGNPISEIDPA